MSAGPVPDLSDAFDAANASAIDVAVNLLWCVPGKVGGSEQYLVRQLLGLASQPAGFVPTIYCLPSFVDAHPDLAELFPMVTASITGDDRKRRVLTEHTWLARRTKSADLVHHGGGTAPRFGGGPVVLTIHDLQYETFPDYISAAKLRYLRAVMPRSVARADVITVPTEYVRGHGHRPLRRRCRSGGRGAARCRARHRRARLVPSSSCGATTGSGRVGCWCFPAITHPHKGHGFLLDVMAAHWDDPDLRLVLMGGPGSADDEVRPTDRATRTGSTRRPDGTRRRPRPRRTDPPRRGTRVPERVRRIRGAGRRGDGVGDTGDLLRSGRVERGRGRWWPGAAARPGGVGRCARPRRIRSRCDAPCRAAAVRPCSPPRSPAKGSPRRIAWRSLRHEPPTLGGHRRALPALRSRQRADRHGDDADRRRTGGARTPGARRDGTAVVPDPRNRTGVDRPVGATARRPSGGRSRVSTRSPATTSRTWSVGPWASSGTRRSPGSRGCGPQDGSVGPTS